ncbi:carboxypeptidase-like regulatory domain-containing protein [Seonamhaeicola maritimus]|uniref:carboxypeptidase-like regulatory domain-containing protein n=1 Tax=Seonamhaeicola maritimus TaxID=2591822 RepID=UPI001F4FB081|nr:carboxypeptidase-like regulatory domain-containing protein [Seonamhaeicola maritimus]
MRNFCLCLSLFCVLFSFSQASSYQISTGRSINSATTKAGVKPFEISGTLVSEEGKLPLESATVYLQRVKDSSLITYTISNQKGQFTLENKTNDSEANFFVSYIGYQTYKKLIKIDNSIIDLGTILLKESTNTLDEVVV